MTREQALGKAAALCGTSEHCTRQIYEKLSSWGIAEGEAADIIDYLVHERYIDNRRFARAYSRDKFRFSHWGRVKIAQMLRRLQLDDDDIAEGMEAISQEEYRQALDDALRRKASSLCEKDFFRAKGKLIRHLLSRGFESDLALAAVCDYLADSGFDVE